MSTITTPEAAVASYAEKHNAIERIVVHTGQGREMALISKASFAIAVAAAAFMIALGGGNVIGWLGVTILGLTTWGAQSRAQYHAKARDAAIDEVRKG